MDSLSFVIVAAGIVVFTLLSRRLENTIITAPMIFVGFGLIIGEAIFGVAKLQFEHGIVHRLAEITLILVLFSDAARIDLRSVLKDHDLPIRMLLIAMPLTVAAGWVAALALPLGLGLWEAALIAAILTPTDAALGQAVISNHRVPVRIRQALNIESGLNDGIALPLVLFFASLAGAAHASNGEQNWLLFGAMQISLGPLAGIIVGGLGAWVLDQAVKSNWMSEAYEGAAILALALLAYSSAELIGGNGFIAAFVAGLVFGNMERGRCEFVFKFAEAEGQLLVLLTFLIFGAAILPEAFDKLSWPIVIYAILSLTVIRMVPVAISLMGSGLSWPSVAFLGWFGPRGLASILFALFVLEEVTTGASTIILVLTIVTVTLSILAHGISAAPLAHYYGNFTSKLGECQERKVVSELPSRTRVSIDTESAKVSTD